MASQATVTGQYAVYSKRKGNQEVTLKTFATASLCSSGRNGIRILLLKPPEFWIYKRVPPPLSIKLYCYAQICVPVLYTAVT